MFEYEKNPAEIYRRSFEIISAEAELSKFGRDEMEIASRIIHACGMVDLARDIIISPNAVDAGLKVLNAGVDIICDTEMIHRGIIRSRLPRNNRLFCALTTQGARVCSQQMHTTLSAGGIEALREKIPGSVVVIGNAPTALFYLLEVLHGGLQPPALIIGCPVGFVGAEESKETLIETAGSIPFITVRGRRGGSAIAAAAFNALVLKTGDQQYG